MKPKRGDRRVKEFFAFLPVTVGTCVKETRWLCKVKVEECYMNDYDFSDNDCYWKKIRFIDENMD